MGWGDRTGEPIRIHITRKEKKRKEKKETQISDLIHQTAMETTQVVQKPVADQESKSEDGLGSGGGSGHGHTPNSSRVKRGTWYQQIPPHMRGIGDESDSDVEVVEEPGGDIKCLICGRRGRHYYDHCPYLSFVPHEAILPPGISRFCKCCFIKDGHPGNKDWKGVAAMMECHHCGTFFEHWPDECPHKDSNDQ